MKAQRLRRLPWSLTLLMLELAARLRDELDVAAMSEDLREMVHLTVQPGHARFWLPGSGSTS